MYKYKPVQAGKGTLFVSFGALIFKNMELYVAVPYFNSIAHYKVTPEHQYIYQAQLIKYEGDQQENKPPSILVLVRGVRRWLGSFDHQGFLNELGHLIEAKMQSEDFISLNA